MPKILLARLLAIACVFCAVCFLPRQVLLYTTIGIAFAHYGTAFLFSPARTRWFAATPVGWASALGVGAVSLLITKLSFPNWALYGIFHYLTSDVRVSAREPLASRGFWLSFAGRLLVNALAAAVMFRRELGLKWTAALTVLWMAALVPFVLSWWKAKGETPEREWAGLIAFEALVTGLTVFSLFHPITFAQASLAHFLFWAVLVAGSLQPNGAEAVANFVGPFAAIAFVVYLLSPVGLFPRGWSQAQWMQAWTYGSNFHITASFLMTAAAQSRMSVLSLRLLRARPGFPG